MNSSVLYSNHDRGKFKQKQYNDYLNTEEKTTMVYYQDILISLETVLTKNSGKLKTILADQKNQNTK